MKNFLADIITRGGIIEHIIIITLSVSSLIGVLDFVGFLPKKIRAFFRLNRADDTLALLNELGIDVDRYRRSNERFRYPKDLTVDNIQDTTKEALANYTIERKVSVGRRRRTELPYYIDLIGATCDPENAKYFAQLLSNYWHTEISNGRTIPHYEFDFVVTPKDGSPFLGYEFSQLINKPLLLHESKKRFSGIEGDMRSVFNCEYVPEKGSTALIVDDSTTGGTMVCQLIDDLKEYGYNVYTCLVVFEPQAKDARSRLSEKGVDLVSITKTHDKKQPLFQRENNTATKVNKGSRNEYLNIVFGDSERIFINFQIGCNCGCKYCYLPILSDYSNPNTKVYSVDEVYRLVINTKGFKKGNNGTILSFGCYSESWTDQTRNKTIELMCKLAELENPMQLSTKMRINIEDILKVDRALIYENQLLIYLSIPTITHAAEMEPGAHQPTERMSILEHKKDLKNIRFVLYIRPVLDDVTIQDTALYGSLMRQYNVPCIVGDYFVKKDYATGKGADSSVGEGHLIETQPKDLQVIAESLKKYGNVYRHSTELVDNLRQ